MAEPEYFWWRADALCAQVGPDLFFLSYGDNGNEAKAVCRMCPVRRQCLTESLYQQEENGIFAGFGRDTRRRLTEQVLAGTDVRVVVDNAIERDTHGHPDHRGRAARTRRRGRAQLHQVAS